MNTDSFENDVHGNSIHYKVPIVGCTQWYHMVISASGKVAACCFDGQVQWPIGDVINDSVMDIYNSENFRMLRERCSTRLEADKPCNSCNIHWGSESISPGLNYTGSC